MRAGYCRQALFFHGRLEGYNTTIRKVWRKIKSELGLREEKYDRFKLDYRSSTRENLNKYLAALHKTGDYPDLLICWFGLHEQDVRLLTESELRLPSGTLILGYHRNGVSYPGQIITFEDSESYMGTMLGAYDALREVMLSATSRKIHRTIEHSLNYKYNMSGVEIPEARKTVSGQLKKEVER